VEKRKLTFPAIVKWRSRNFKPFKPFPYQVIFKDEDDRTALDRMNVYEFIYDKVNVAQRVEGVQINGEVFWTQGEGFKFELEELDDVMYDTKRRTYSSKRQNFIDFFKK